MLQVSNLSKTYADGVILENISFVVDPGERVGLVGPNGCGKTTLHCPGRSVQGCAASARGDQTGAACAFRRPA